MKLVDDIAQAIENERRYKPKDYTQSIAEATEDTLEKRQAQAAIDVVDRRLSKIMVESSLDSLDFEENTATFSVPEDSRWIAGEYLIIDKTAWQAVKGS